MKIGNCRVLGSLNNVWQKIYSKVIAAPTYSSRQNVGGTPTSSGAIGGSTDAMMWDIAGGQGYISGTVTTGWAQYQFSSAKIIRAIDMNGQDYGAGYTIPASFTIQGSNNGSSWTTLMTVATAGLTSGVTKRFEFYNNVAYSYLRVNITGWTSSDTYGGVGLEAYTMTNQDDGPVTSLTISGLNGDVDQEYRLVSRIVNGYNGDSIYSVSPNNDTGTNYGYQYVRGINSATSAGRGTGTSLIIGATDGLGKITQGNLIIQAKSGYVRTAIVDLANTIATTTVTLIGLYGLSWNNTADNITSLVILSDKANGLGGGTVIELYRRIS